MELSIGLRTDPGPREGPNQDAVFGTIFAGHPASGLLIVADGMGGAKAGEHASQEAVATMRHHLLDQALPTPETAPERLCEAIKAANLAIYEKSMSSPEMEGMGCTIVAALILGGVYWIASVGDSRAYLIRGKDTCQLTDDHTWVNARVREGLLTPEQAASHSLRHVLDRALGAEMDIKADVLPEEILAAGDTLVFCTDGLYSVLNEEDIVGVISTHPAQEAADALVEYALDASTHDNVSVIVLRTEG